MSFDSSKDFKTNSRVLERALKASNSAMVSISTKTIKTKNGLIVNKNDYIGIIDKEIKSASDDLLLATRDIIKLLVAKKNVPCIYLIYGIETNDNEVSKIQKYINEQLGAKCKLIDGGQKIYRFYIGF